MESTQWHARQLACQTTTYYFTVYLRLDLLSYMGEDTTSQQYYWLCCPIPDRATDSECRANMTMKAL